MSTSSSLSSLAPTEASSAESEDEFPWPQAWEPGYKTLRRHWTTHLTNDVPHCKHHQSPTTYNHVTEPTRMKQQAIWTFAFQDIPDTTTITPLTADVFETFEIGDERGRMTFMETQQYLKSEADVSNATLINALIPVVQCLDDLKRQYLDYLDAFDLVILAQLNGKFHVVKKLNPTNNPGSSTGETVDVYADLCIALVPRALRHDPTKLSFVYTTHIRTGEGATDGPINDGKTAYILMLNESKQVQTLFANDWNEDELNGFLDGTRESSALHNNATKIFRQVLKYERSYRCSFAIAECLGKYVILDLRGIRKIDGTDAFAKSYDPRDCNRPADDPRKQAYANLPLVQYSFNRNAECLRSDIFLICLYQCLALMPRVAFNNSTMHYITSNYSGTTGWARFKRDFY